MKGFPMDKTERELAPALALEDDPDGRDVAIPDSVCRVRLAGSMAVCNPPWARHSSALAGGIRK
jgi:hypothetical protein